MPNWKKILLNGGNGELTTLKLTDLTEDSTGTKILTLDSNDNIKLTASFSGGGIQSITGTTNQISVTSGNTPTLSIPILTNSIGFVRGGQSSAQSTPSQLTGGSSDNGKFLRFNYASEGVAGNASTWSLESISVSLTSNVTGTLPEANGGTGVTSLSSLDLSEFNNDLSLGDLSGTLAVSKGGTGTTNGGITATGNIITTGEVECSKFIANAGGAFEFDIEGNAGFNMRHTVANQSMFFLTTAGTGEIKFGTNNQNSKVIITSTGALKSTVSLSVGAITPSTTVGRIDAANDVVAYSTSDERLKKSIKPIPNALDKVLQIRGVEFNWKKADKKMQKEVHSFEGHDVGVIAQEVEAVLPEVVITRDSGYKAVKYEKIVPLLIEAIKDQQKQIDELKSKL
jgi:hypothetical protein|tara:strand:- start:14874 stop:16067 length:1194 start_codon:yes stop_codon:yes gene_type:complete